MPGEFACNGLMSTVPGDDGGCTCFGCRANRAIAKALSEERANWMKGIDYTISQTCEQCAKIADEHARYFRENGQINEAEVSEGIAAEIRTHAKPEPA
jgi:hypothetical protein